MKAIYKREVSSYFNSMIGWIFVAVLTVFIGIYFFAYNLFQGYPYFSLSLGSSLFIFMVVVPILTMRSMADERHTKTDQLLLTAPVSVTAVVLGKYFAMLTVFAVPVAIACLCPLIIALNGTAFLLADYGAILAFFLLGAVEIAVGMLISSLTESQIIAAVGTFGLLLLLYLWDGLVGFLPSTAVGSLLGFFVVLILVCFLINALCAAYGMQVADGMIADTSQGYQNNPYLFFAQADTSVDAASSLTSDSMVLFYASRGFTLADPTRDTITVQPFLTTTENGYAVLDADNMTQGTYVVGAVATEEISEDTTARLTVYGADTLINTDVTNSFTNVDNVDLFIHSATVGFDDVSAISVEPVSLLTPTNTITTGGIWGLLFILVIPAALLIYGFVRWMHRRKL